MSKELTCEERIEDSMNRMEDHLSLVFRVLDEDTFDEDDEDDQKQLKEIEDDGIDRETIYEIAAGSSIHRVVTIVLSGGGPSTHIEAHLDEDGNIEKATYHYLDWWDGAKRKINENSALYRFVEWEVERYM
ncbi:MAG: hypothetical protein RLZZ184_1532 [Cyanobacteriota bacterium]|jgi:hypothetical protein